MKQRLHDTTALLRMCLLRSFLLVLFLTLLPQPDGTCAQEVRATQELTPFADTALHHLVQRALEQMDGFHGDSAMKLINLALDRIDPDNDPEATHYLLAYRAEVLYYEGLFNEAMRDLDEAERLAHLLEDSTLVANAYNLKGLLHENIQNSQEALPYMRLALAWFPHRPAARYPVTELHHIHGNLGSYLTTLGRLDSAQYHVRTSLALAARRGAPRATAVAYWALGNIALIRGEHEDALHQYDRSYAIADSAQDHDIGVDALAGRCLALAFADQPSEARIALGQASAYLIEHQQRIGLVTQRNFARQAARAYEHLGELSNAMRSLSTWHAIDSTITANNIRSALTTQALLLEADNDLQLERVERDRMAEQITNEQRARNWVILASLLAIAAISTIYLVNSARQRHKRRLAELETEHALQERTIVELRVREQVSRDLHDDLGVGLSALKLRSEMSLIQDPQASTAPLLREQASTAEDLIISMRHIIWALQDDQGSLEDLVAYISSYARTYLDAHGTTLTVDADGRWPALELTTHQRRNIFLIVKEALHNVVKHARAGHVALALHWSEGLTIRIDDDGVGMHPPEARIGHGLVNMRKRAMEVNATLHVGTASHDKGTRILLCVPFGPNKS